MASISDLNKRLRLEGEREAVLRAIKSESEAHEREALRRVLAKIELELKNSEPVFPEVSEMPQTSILPDSYYHEPLPSKRARFKSSLNEGAPKKQK